MGGGVGALALGPFLGDTHSELKKREADPYLYHLTYYPIYMPAPTGMVFMACDTLHMHETRSNKTLSMSRHV